MLFFSIHTSSKLSRLHPPPSKQKKGVWMKRMNIHEIFMTVKVSVGDKCRSGFWTRHLIIYLRTAWEFGGDCQKSSTMMSQVRNSSNKSIYDLRAEVQRWPVVNHIKDTTGLAQTLKDGGRPGLRKLSPWPHVQSQYRNLLGARAKPEPANKAKWANEAKMKIIYLLSCFSKPVQLFLICKTQKETFSIQQRHNDQGLTSSKKNKNK